MFDRNLIDKCFSIPDLVKVSSHKFAQNCLAIQSEWNHIDVNRKEKVIYSKTQFVLDSNDISASSPAVFTSNQSPLWDITHPSGLRAVCVEVKQDNSITASTKATFPNVGTFITIWFQDRQIKTIRLPVDSKVQTYPAGDKPAKTENDSFVLGKVLSFKINSSCPFAAAQWSSDKKKILFMAELSQCNQNSKEIPLTEDAFRWQDKWGETLTEIQNPTICVLEVETERFSQIPARSLDCWNMCCGQATWAPDNQGIVFIGHSLTPYKLGLSYCLQRPARLFLWSFVSNCVTPISSPRHSARSPRFSPDNKHLVWLDMFIGGPHLQCQRLLYASWSQIQAAKSEDDISHIKELIPLVDYSDSNGEKFPGLYCPFGLPTNCWTKDSRYLCFSSCWGFSNAPVVVDILGNLKIVQETESNLGPTKLLCPIFLPCVLVKNTKIPHNDWSNPEFIPQEIAILDITDENIIIARVSACSVPNILAYLKLPETLSEQVIKDLKWNTFLNGYERINRGVIDVSGIGIQNLSYKLFNHATTIDEDDTFGVKSFQSLLIYPNAKQVDSSSVTELSAPEMRGIIMIIHGGPHSTFISRWYPTISTFLSHGFGCLFVNYRGSIGYGDASIKCLLGKIGFYDVNDCVMAGDDALEYIKTIGFTQKPLFIYGGSHGGFLTCHLAARYGTSKYKAAVALNPVTDLSSMGISSDICDWSFVEAGLAQLESSQGRVDTETSISQCAAPRGQLWYMGQVARGASTLERLSLASPITYVDNNWNIPIYFFLGAKDLRVSPFQGESFYKRVKACTAKSQIKCQAFVYPNDSHQLDSVACQIDKTSRILDFFDTNCYI